MATARITMGMNVEGADAQGAVNLVGSGVLFQNPSLPAGFAGTVTDRTDANTGVCTVAASPAHNIITSDKVAVFWVDANGSPQLRREMDATVTVNAIAVEGGAGTDLPVATTAVVVTKMVSINENFVGNELKCLSVQSPQRVSCEFQDSGGASLLPLDVAAGGMYTWDGTGTNPLAGDTVADIRVANGSTTAAVIKVIGLKDSVS